MYGRSSASVARKSFSNRDIIADEDGPPLSSAPISLEDYVKHKPGRSRTGRGGKWSGSLRFEREEENGSSTDETVVESETNPSGVELQNQSQLIPQSVLPRQASAHTSRCLSSADLRSSNTIAKSPLMPKAYNDGDFYQEILSNGDLSIYQWYERDQVWVFLGQIGQSDVSTFTRFYENTYPGAHSSLENQTLCINHIVAVIKHYSDRRRNLVDLQGRRRRVSSEILQQTPLLKQSEILINPRGGTQLSRASDPFPVLPMARSELNAITKPSVSINPIIASQERRPYHQLQLHQAKPLITQSANSTNRSASSQQTFIPTDKNDREDLREAERRRISLEDVLARPENSVQGLSNGEKSQLTLSKRPSSMPSHQSDNSTSVLPPSSNQDLRRTVLHDPFKVKPVSLEDFQASLKNLHQPTYSPPASSPEYLRAFDQSTRATSMNSHQSTSTDPSTTWSTKMVDLLERKPVSQKQIEIVTDPSKIPPWNPKPSLGQGSGQFKLTQLLKFSPDQKVPDDSATLSKPKSQQADPQAAGVRQDYATLRELVKDSEPDPIPSPPPDFTIKSHHSEAPGERHQTTSEEYEDSVNKFWNSGRARFNSLMGKVDKGIRSASQPVSREAELGLRLLFPVVQSLQEYNFSQNLRAAGGRDHFAPFVTPPKHCIDTSDPTSLFEDRSRLEK